MAKSKKTKHKVKRKRTQQNLYTGPIPVQFVKHLKELIRSKSKSMSEYNALVDEKYKSNTTTTYINMGMSNKPLCEIYNNGECFAIAGQVIALTWYKYSKTIYKMSQSILDYIDNTFCIPDEDEYDEILNNLPQKIIYVDLSDTNMMSYEGDKIYGFFINVSSTPYREYIDMSNGEHYKIEDIKERALEFTGILSVVSDQLPTMTVIGSINAIASRDHNIPSDYVGNQYSIWLNKLVLKMALYLCISKPITESIKKINPTNNTQKDLTIIDLGDQYKEGSVFDPHRKEKVKYVRKASEGEPSYHVQPHIRTGHWHTYWTGKDRSVPIQKFVKECFINCDDATKLPTIGRKIKDVKEED